jgi:predicted Mrr-cat superfamily restriction endonuclease
MTTAIQKGDLVRGKKPWNRDTIVGIVVEENVGQDAPPTGDTFKVFWLNDSEKNQLSSKKTFLTWEILDSLERILDDN